MKNPILGMLNQGLIILLFGVLFVGCAYHGKISVDEDVVFSSKKVKWECTYSTYDFAEFLAAEQTIVKEIKQGGEVSYTSFDILTFSNEVFKLEEKAFIIIDNEPVPLSIDFIDYGNHRTFKENTKEILTSDSTKVSVVTGYSESNRNITRVKYQLSAEVMEKVQYAKEVVMFRYYAGPEMISLKVKGNKLERLKQFISTQ